CVAGGQSVPEALERIDDAIAAWIEAAMADGVPVPPPSPADEDYSGRFVLRIAKGLHRQLARQAKREGVSLNAYCSSALTQAATMGQVAELWSRPRTEELTLYLTPAVYSTGLTTIYSPGATAAQSSHVWSAQPHAEQLARALIAHRG
ncbi:MAG: toxin-antitoxin system HicB family antitoxin, partial [Candidatus Dormibacterales bacterium]